jgi:hypothetical protein
MKDHQIRNIIGQVLLTAHTYQSNEQLRDRITDILLPILKSHQSMQRCLTNVFAEPVERCRRDVYVSEEDVKCAQSALHEARESCKRF